MTLTKLEELHYYVNRRMEAGIVVDEQGYRLKGVFAGGPHTEIDILIAPLTDEDKFCCLMAAYIKENNFHTRYNKNVTPEQYADWVFDRAMSDGQGGWGLTFKKTWGKLEAKELVNRFVENERWEEEEYC